ncbi:MAG: hypothetical protein LAO20_09190 [Acidobacteriia bacterium]|nr:hypothetical protein [Terriglobia bacterium]
MTEEELKHIKHEIKLFVNAARVWEDSNTKYEDVPNLKALAQVAVFTHGRNLIELLGKRKQSPELEKYYAHICDAVSHIKLRGKTGPNCKVGKNECRKTLKEPCANPQHSRWNTPLHEEVGVFSRELAHHILKHLNIPKESRLLLSQLG